MFSFGFLHFQRKTEKIEMTQWGPTKMLVMLENLVYKERLKYLGFFQPAEEKAQCNLITVFQYLKG